MAAAATAAASTSSIQYVPHCSSLFSDNTLMPPPLPPPPPPPPPPSPSPHTHGERRKKKGLRTQRKRGTGKEEKREEVMLLLLCCFPPPLFAGSPPPPPPPPSVRQRGPSDLFDLFPLFSQEKKKEEEKVKIAGCSVLTRTKVPSVVVGGSGRSRVPTKMRSGIATTRESAKKDLLLPGVVCSGILLEEKAR